MLTSRNTPSVYLVLSKKVLAVTEAQKGEEVIFAVQSDSSRSLTV